MYQTLQYEENNFVATVRLNRPEKKNSLNAQMRGELGQLFREIAEKPTVRVLIITGNEEIFCAGADIGEIHGTQSGEATYKHAREFQLLFDRLDTLPQPTIATVSGYALGGGCELALATDFRIASNTARFGLPEIKIGALEHNGSLGSSASQRPSK